MNSRKAGIIGCKTKDGHKNATFKKIEGKFKQLYNKPKQKLQLLRIKSKLAQTYNSYQEALKYYKKAESIRGSRCKWTHHLYKEIVLGEPKLL